MTKRSYIPIEQAYPNIPFHSSRISKRLVRIMRYKKALEIELPWQLKHEA